MNAVLGPFLHGAATLGCLAITFAFLRFWRVSKDRFFLWFATAFVAFGVGWTLRALVPAYLMYIPRLVGFLLIICAIVDKNRRGRS